MTPQSAFNSDVFSSQSALDSILATQQAMEYQPEDLRSVRYGYNPGWRSMVMDSRLCGLQSGAVEPGKLTIFKSFPIAKQNFKAVDAGNPEPKAIAGELLAGEQIANLLASYEPHGFREITPLRGVEDVRKAVNLFVAAHPPLAAGVAEGIIPECPYVNHEEYNGVCLSCREQFLDALVRPINGEADVAKALKGSIAAGKLHMTGMWNSWVVELSARMNNAAGDKGALGVLSPGHLYVMRQLHKQTPSDADLAKVNAANNAMAQSMNDLKETLASALQAKNDDRVAELSARLDAQQREFNEKIDRLVAQGEAREEQKEEKRPKAAK